MTGNQKEFLNTHDKAIVKDKDTYMYSVWIGKVQTFQKRYKLYLTSLDLKDTTIMGVSSGIYEKHEIGDTINTGILWRKTGQEIRKVLLSLWEQVTIPTKKGKERTTMLPTR